MGVELTHKYTEYRAMEDQEEVEEGVSVTDWDLVYHVRDALLSVKTVSCFLFLNFIFDS